MRGSTLRPQNFILHNLFQTWTRRNYAIITLGGQQNDFLKSLKNSHMTLILSYLIGNETTNAVIYTPLVPSKPYPIPNQNGKV